MATVFNNKRLKTIANESLSQTEMVLLNDSKVPYALTVFPTIIESIFKFLPARDLGSCALVCSAWNTIASSIKRRRRTILFIGMNELAEEKPLLETLLRCWSEPNLAIVFGALGIHIDVEMDVFDGLMDEDLEHSVRKVKLGLSYDGILQEILRSMNDVRMCLPKKCHLIRVPVTTFCKMLGDDTVRFNSLTSLIVPSLSGVEMGVFSLKSTDANFEMDIEMGKLYVPKLGINNASGTDLKCILLFSNYTHNTRTLKKDILANTPLENSISDKTVIAGGRVVCLPVIAGITFAGENVDIECVCLTRKECCVRSLLTGLRRLGFHRKTGVAFLLSTFISQKFTCSLFQELFPNFLILGVVCEDDGLMYPSCITNTSVKQCDKCGTLLSTHDHEVLPSVVIIFVMFQQVHCEIIKL